MKTYIKNILVIGSGVMGQSIAQFFSQQKKKGIEKVYLTDVEEKQLEKSKQRIFDSWNVLVQKKKFTAEQMDEFKSCLTTVQLNNLTSSDYDSFDLVIEAIVEDKKCKIELFSHIQDKLSAQCIVATNTSSLSVNELALHFDEFRRAYFLGMHFFNPATIMPLVEIIKTPFTLESIVLECTNWLTACLKQVAILDDSPGFLVNRCARNFYNESMHIISNLDGNLTTNCLEIDSIMKEVGGFPMGPFALMDLIGLDINYKATSQVWEDFYYHPRFAPHALQKKLVQLNNLGVKTKKGFYEYN